jgi:hypothetical protein
VTTLAVGQLERRRGQREVATARVEMHRLQCLGPKAALRLVVDALEREIVRGLGDDPEIGQRIANLGALVETKTPTIR